MTVQVVGVSVAKPDALEKALGTSRYTVDLSLPRTLVGRALGSVYSHALVRGVDTSRAEKVPGVKAVVTAADAPPALEGHMVRDSWLIARDRVRYAGEPIAAVAAVDEDAALEALELIEVEYEPLPGVFDPEEALREDAPLVHPEWASYDGLAGTIRAGNCCGRSRIALGDMEAAFRGADLVVEETYQTQMVHQAYLEPIAVLVEYDPTGRYTFWMSTKAIFGLQAKLATLLKVPHTNVRCIAPAVGGSFGGKHDVVIEAIAALLARKASRPVKMSLTRYEEFTIARPRHAARVTIKSGVTSDGRILGRKVRAVYDTGAYAGTGPGVMSRGVTYGSGPYQIESVDIEGLCVYTNKIPAGAFRGYGSPQVHFAFESHTDVLAEKLGMDPLEFRLKNALREGMQIPLGERMKSGALPECLKLAAERIGWGKPSAPNRGIGIAAVWKGSGTQTSAAEVRLQRDGSFALEIGAMDVGQGSNTVLCQMAAQTLGVPFGRVRIGPADTASSPYDWGSASSRVTSIGGRAVQRAAEDLRDKILRVAAPMLEADPTDLEIDTDSVRVKGVSDRRVALSAIGGLTYGKLGVLQGYGTAAVQTHQGETLATLEGLAGVDHQNISFGAVACEVEVDPESGQVRPLRIVAANDVGKAINPQLVAAQIEGSVIQGLGYGLSEEQVEEDGIIRNTLLNDYLLPTVIDAPVVEAIAVEGYDASGPFGAKGIGEHALVSVAPALANAVRAAVGARVREIPLRPERVLQAIREQHADKGQGHG